MKITITTDVEINGRSVKKTCTVEDELKDVEQIFHLSIIREYINTILNELLNRE
jgi:hypothetical protein